MTEQDRLFLKKQEEVNEEKFNSLRALMISNNDLINSNLDHQLDILTRVEEHISNTTNRVTKAEDNITNIKQKMAIIDFLDRNKFIVIGSFVLYTGFMIITFMTKTGLLK